jgi:ubiquinone/menaquinone biosynthesis C-methylase UbiE
MTAPHLPWPRPLGRLPSLLLSLSVLLGLSCATPSRAAEDAAPAVDPGINAYYRDAEVDRWKTIFENHGREVFRERFRIVHAAGPRPGMRVADIGAGTGFFSLLFARAVGPTGKVYAVDISETFLAEIRRRAAEEFRVDNLETVLNDQDGIGLPDDSIDLAFLCDTYHHLEYPQRMLSSIADALREEGELIIVDFRRIPGVSSPWVMGHVRANREEVVEELKAAGFHLVGEEDFLRENYFLRFRRRAGSDHQAGRRPLSGPGRDARGQHERGVPE